MPALTSPHAGNLTDDQKRKAAAALGSIRSEKKAASSAKNGALAPPGPGRSPAPLFSLACSCGAGDVTEGHKTSCPRGQAVKRRQREGRDLLTGEKS